MTKLSCHFLLAGIILINFFILKGKLTIGPKSLGILLWID